MFQKDPFEIVREVDYTNSIPYNAKPKYISLKGCNSVKNNFIATKTPNHIFIMSTKSTQGFKKIH